MIKHLCLVSALLVLAGCSGGGDTPQAITPTDKPQEKPVPDKGTAEGLWAGSTYTGWTRETTVLDDGTYYTLYSAPSGASGVIQGTGVSENGVFTSANARDFNFEDKTVLDATIAATYTERQRLSGSTTYPGLGTVGFTDGVYASSYDLEPSVPELPVLYMGMGVSLDAAYLDSDVFLRVTPGTSPEVTYAALSLRGGAAQLHCDLNGTMTPRAHGNVFDVNMTVAVADDYTTCNSGTQTLVGIAYFTPPRHITLLATTNNRTNALVFTGNSPNQQ